MINNGELAASLAAVKHASENMTVVLHQLHDAVADARDAGATWADIGHALGVSRQAAWERFARSSSGAANPLPDFL